MPENNLGDLLRYDDYPAHVEGGIKTGSPFIELGQTGLKRAGGIVDEEFLPALRGRKAIKVFREMSLNDPIVGSLLFTMDKLLRQVEWRVEAPDNTPDSTEAADFVEQCMEDMSHTWSDLITEILSMLIFGWSWHEVVYKRRLGPWEKDPRKKSKYTDGRIGWRKMPIRSQETMLRWIFDEQGGIKGMVQLAPPHYDTTILSIEKSLLFRLNSAKGNPEGQSLLRNAYRPWFFKKRLEEFEAIGVERDLAGMPVAKLPSSYMNAPPDSKEYKVYQAFKKMVMNVRRDEHEGLVLPLEYDRETKQPLFEFDLMSSGGARQFDTTAIIQRYEQRILMTVLADFIMVGHEGTGSYALHVDKTGIFRAALNTVAQAIADVFNRHAIPRLFDLNAWRLDELPRIVPNNVDPPNLTELSQFMSAMGGLGMEWFPDPELEKFLRETAHLPELPDELLELRRQMALQHNVSSFAMSQMEFLGMQQKAQLTAQGYSPEQAQMLSEQPTPEMQEQELQMAQGQAQIEMAGEQAKFGMEKERLGLDQQRLQLEDQKAQNDLKREKERLTLQDKYKTSDFRRQRDMGREQDKLKDRDHRRQKESLAQQDKFKERDAKRSAFMDRAKAKQEGKKPSSKRDPKGKK